MTTRTTRTASINFCGDILKVYWTGSVWESRCNGSQHSSPGSALASELRHYLRACGDDEMDGTPIDEIDGVFVADHFDIE